MPAPYVKFLAPLAARLLRSTVSKRALTAASMRRSLSFRWPDNAPVVRVRGRRAGARRLLCPFAGALVRGAGCGADGESGEGLRLEERLRLRGDAPSSALRAHECVAAPVRGPRSSASCAISSSPRSARVRSAASGGLPSASRTRPALLRAMVRGRSARSCQPRVSAAVCACRRTRRPARPGPATASMPAALASIRSQAG